MDFLVVAFYPIPMIQKTEIRFKYTHVAIDNYDISARQSFTFYWKFFFYFAYTYFENGQISLFSSKQK